jgi:hypothetical protein
MEGSVLIYVTGGHFMHKGEGAKGLWQRAELPDLPDMSLVEELMEEEEES